MNAAAARLVLLILCCVLTTQALAKRLPHVRGELFTPPFGKLTQFWAQQATGIPEGHAFLRKLEQQHFAFATPQLGVVDTGFIPASLLTSVRLTPQLQQYLSANAAEPNAIKVLANNFPSPLRDLLLPRKTQEPVPYRSLRHGSVIANLLAGNTAAAVSLKGELAMLLPLPKNRKLDDRKTVRTLLAALPLPEIVNYSLRFSYDEEKSVSLAAAIQPLATKTILVLSAGNKAPAPIEVGKHKLAAEAIIVGSADPTGQVSLFSQTGCSETIRACSDKFIQSVSPQSGEFFNFGGTSAAAPMVSAALADTLSILPDLSSQQAKLLLQHSALTNSYSDDVGLLNYYKLLRVAYRLAAQGWSAKTGAIEVLHDPALYDFRAESEQLSQAAMATSDNAKAFRQLRQAFFLDDNNSIARTMLAEMYRQHGYEAQAFFYDNPKPKARDAFIEEKDRQQQATIAKFLVAMAETDTAIMLTLIPDLNTKHLFKNMEEDVINALQVLSPAQRMLIVDFLQTQALATVDISAEGIVTSVERILE